MTIDLIHNAFLEDIRGAAFCVAIVCLAALGVLAVVLLEKKNGNLTILIAAVMPALGFIIACGSCIAGVYAYEEGTKQQYADIVAERYGYTEMIPEIKLRGNDRICGSERTTPVTVDAHTPTKRGIMLTVESRIDGNTCHIEVFHDNDRLTPDDHEKNRSLSPMKRTDTPC